MRAACNAAGARVGEADRAAARGGEGQLAAAPGVPPRARHPPQRPVTPACQAEACRKRRPIRASRGRDLNLQCAGAAAALVAASDSAAAVTKGRAPSAGRLGAAVAARAKAPRSCHWRVQWPASGSSEASGAPPALAEAAVSGAQLGGPRWPVPAGLRAPCPCCQCPKRDTGGRAAAPSQGHGRFRLSPRA